MYIGIQAPTNYRSKHFRAKVSLQLLPVMPEVADNFVIFNRTPRIFLYFIFPVIFQQIQMAKTLLIKIKHIFFSFHIIKN